MKSHCLLLLLLSTSFCFAENISLNTMSTTESNVCGINKLTEQEKVALQKWIDTKIEQEKMTASPQKIDFNITEIDTAGKFIVLSDRNSYRIDSSSDRNKVKKWLLSDTVTLSPTSGSSIKLENKRTQEKIKGKKAKVIPADKPLPTPVAETEKK